MKNQRSLISCFVVSYLHQQSHQNWNYQTVIFWMQIYDLGQTRVSFAFRDLFCLHHYQNRSYLIYVLTFDVVQWLVFSSVVPSCLDLERFWYFSGDPLENWNVSLIYEFDSKLTCDGFLLIFLPCLKWLFVFLSIDKEINYEELAGNFSNWSIFRVCNGIDFSH